MEIGLDAGMYRLNRDVAREALAKPPFAAPSDDARLARVGARITWTGPQRVTLEQARMPFGMPKGEWAIAVPLDAEGRQIPSASLETSVYVDEPDPQRPRTLPPLDWEHRRLPLRQEIATAQPIVALQLRHYNWQQVPRAWKLRNARHMKEPAQQR